MHVTSFDVSSVWRRHDLRLGRFAHIAGLGTSLALVRLEVSGVRVKRVSSDYREIDVQMVPHFYNRNFVGTHFGGNLSDVTGPWFWFMVMFMLILGAEYLVWSKHGPIDFVKPGRGKVRSEFRIIDTVLEKIQAATANGDKYLPTFAVGAQDQADKVVALLERTVYILREQRG
jgi:hypothetical protein